MAVTPNAHSIPRARPRRRAARRTPPRVRWDQLARIAMLGVMAALVYLYLSAGIHMFSTWRQAHRDSAAVATLEHEHGTLQRQHERLSQPGMLEAEARQLGMMKKNEQPYVISGLPGN
ncbi:MAG TPA: septum formation initiator family protein [Solirubrobacteraceae bacterium]|jgi:cell division protein FtsB